MNRKSPLLILSIFILCSTLACHRSQALFQENGNDWKVHGEADWQFSGKELIGSITDGAGFVMTEQSYKDFMLELEFKPDSTINSGVFIRCKEEEINPVDCYELNIWDLHPDQDNRTGAVVTRVAPLAYVETIDKWNSFKIKAAEDRIQVWVNNTLTADLKDEELAAGFIGLQAKGNGVVSFRNVKIQSLIK